jgi:SAM-dependent methyltransferase
MSESQATGSGQRTTEWELDGRALPYHLGQWLQPKQSTHAFAAFAGERLAASRTVADLGCGAGAATAQLALQFPGTRFVGIDYAGELVAMARERSGEAGISNIEFAQGDWYDLAPRSDLDGVVSLQTLSWLPEFERPLACIFERFRPRWVALSSLFYEGDISCRIEVTEHTLSKSCFYNVYSLPAVRRLAEQHGYRLARSEPFHIGLDLPRPASADLMGTYTVNTAPQDGQGSRRLQISGPLLMNWHFVMLERLD